MRRGTVSVDGKWVAYRDCECHSSKGREFGSDKHEEVAEAAIKHFRAQLHAPVFNGEKVS